MNDEQKKKVKGVAVEIAAQVQETAEKKAKAASGWAKVAWILAAIGAAVVGYFTNASQVQPDVSEPPAAVDEVNLE